MSANFEQTMLDKIDTILRLLALLVTKGMNQREQITLLNQAGIGPKEMSNLLGTTSNTVNVTLTSIRKAGPSKKKRKSTN